MTTVAVIGTSGTLGNFVLEALSNPVVGTFKYPIKAITSKQKESNDKVQYIKSDLKDPSLPEKIAGVDVLINLGNVVITNDVEQLVKIVKPKVYIPGEFGVHFEDYSKVFPSLMPERVEHAERCAKVDGVKVVRISTSYFKIRPFLYDFFGHIGIDSEQNTVTYYGNPEELKFSFSYGQDIANSIVSICATDPKELLSSYRIQSGEISLADVVKQYEEDHNVRLTPIYKNIDEERVIAQKKLAESFDSTDLVYYLTVILGHGKGYGAWFSATENEVLNPSEKYWTWTKY